LAVVDLRAGTVSRQINVGIAPWDVVLSPDGNTAYVSDWGGRLPVSGDLTATSAGTPVVIDDRGVGASGAVSFVNLTTGIETIQVPTGLHPSALALSEDGSSLYVANANSDTVTAIDTRAKAVKETILVRPDPTFPYGSSADGLALSLDGKNLFLANGGNNAVAIVELPNAQHTNSLLKGFIPTDWYPGAVAADSNYLYVANVKGLGSRAGQPATTSWQIYAFLGTANRIPIPDADALSKLTAQAYEDGRIPQIKQTQQPPLAGQAPVPVPLHVGEPSVFQHVLYILKENKTYDQMFGDMPEGNGNASLCIYPQYVSPNHHALARQYVLLDNFYCNGVNSAEGHSWSTEGNNTDHLEKSYGGFTRSYTFGDDPLTYSSSGFVWNNVLQHGLTFRNYGEFDYASPVPTNATWLQIYRDFTNGIQAIHYAQNIGVASLRPYSSTNVPGWNLGIPDVVRAGGFIRELNAAQAKGTWATFHLLYLPNDHTGGPPTPQAQVADNDLALGQVVEAVTKSSFGCNTVIFVIEDDPQSGYDHVDAHRSLCLVISPYTKRGRVISTFYNQAGVLHTMEQIMGLPPMNQQDAMAPLMFECFTNVPDFTPYAALTNNVDLASGTAGSAKLSPKQQYWAKRLQNMDFSKPDRINDDVFNRYIWFTVRGDVPYPAKFVGGHGKGLKRLGLLLDKSRDDD
jgi:YVTN family beta-propeller protein